jgi:pentalenolactone synthase
LWWAIRYVLRVRTNVVLIAASALGYCFFAAVQSFAILYVTGHYGIPESIASLLTLVVGIGGLAGVFLGGRIADRLLTRGRIRARVLVPAVSLLATSVVFAPAITTTSIALALPLLALAAALLGATNPPLDAARLDIMHSALWGRAEAVRTLLHRSRLRATAPTVNPAELEHDLGKHRTTPMTATREDLPRLPFPRPGVLDIAPLYRTLQTSAPITPVRTSAGDVAWLVTGYPEVKALFADPRLGRSHPDPRNAARISHSAILGGPSGDAATEAADHALMRRLLTPAFTARRMQALRAHVTDLVETLLDRLAEHGPPADLHELLSFPLPVKVICELLGVPYSDREQFRVWSAGAGNLTNREAATGALAQLVSYMHQLITHKRTHPGQDVISDLIAAQDQGHYDDDGIAELAATLLFAGHETTVTRIDFGTLLLLTHPDQCDALRRDPELVASAVEEILRIATPSGGGVPRYAHDDIDIAGVTIRTGDAVLLNNLVANRDATAFPDPDRFDVTRIRNLHLSFGYGPHFCIGAGLARIELHAVFTSLPRRFPTLELAVPFDQLKLRGDLLTGGLTALPVTW